MKTGLNNLTPSEIEEAEDALDPFSFEKYCGACIFFDTEDCPFQDKVDSHTNWKEKGCEKFYD